MRWLHFLMVGNIWVSTLLQKEPNHSCCIVELGVEARIVQRRLSGAILPIDICPVSSTELHTHECIWLGAGRTLMQRCHLVLVSHVDRNAQVKENRRIYGLAPFCRLVQHRLPFEIYNMDITAVSK